MAHGERLNGLDVLKIVRRVKQHGQELVLAAEPKSSTEHGRRSAAPPRIHCDALPYHTVPC